MPRSDFATKLLRPIEWVFLALGVALVVRYRWILDDAFVYFRYADNVLFLHRGLVYNDGEYVEGYSSPLWMLVTLALRTTLLDWWKLTVIVAAVSFVIFALLLVRLNRRLAPEGPIANVPLAYLALCYGVSCYFSSGLETPLVQIAAVIFALFVSVPASRAAQLAVGLMPVVRPELALVLPIATAWAWRRTRRGPWWLLASATVAGLGWLVFRVAYYADLFPNTFYLKDEVSIRRGLVYVQQTARTYHLYVLVALLTGAAAWIAGKGRREGFEPRWAERGVMIAAALAVTAYVVKIGGDFRHHRMLAFPFVLLVSAGAGLVEELLSRAARARGAWLAPAVGLAAAAVAFSGVPPQLDRHPITRREQHELAEGIGDAAWDRHLPALAYSDRNARLDRDLRGAYRGTARGHRGTLTTSLCVDAYVAFPYRVVNSLGLTDAILARTDAPTDWAGHKYSLHARAEDLVAMHQDGPIDRGAFRRRVEEGRAPDWIRDNLESVEVVARKIYNRGDWRENLALAFTFPPRIRVPARGEVNGGGA